MGGPSYSIRARLPTEGELMSTRSPGPIYNQEVPKGPSYSIRERLPTEGELMSIRSPGPIYSPDVKKGPCYSIRERLPTEADLMSIRSPGPCTYSGAAVDAKKQAEVDSTKKRIKACSFGIGARFSSP